MKRIEKNKNKYKKKINKKYKIIIEFIKYLICFIVGVVYIIYKLIRWFNDLIVKIFLKLPRIMKAIIIYFIIGLSIYNYFNPKIIIKEKIKVKEEVIKIELDKSNYNPEIEKTEIKENDKINKLSEIEKKIYYKALENELTENQAFIILAISKHETGNWSSKAFLNKNNLGGIMCNTGLRSYNSLDEGITAFIQLLKNRYFLQGLDTIEKIQPIYCPIGADNDPNNLNQYWLPNVSKYYNEYIN